MSKVFTRTFRVRWCEVDPSGQVGIANYLRYLVEAAWDWGATGGLGVDDVDTLGQIWVIRETEVNILRPLRYNDVFDFTIWMLRWRRVRGTRAFELKHKENGEIIAQGAQQVACLDAQTLRPTTPPPYLDEHFRLDNPRVLPQRRFPRVPPPPKAAFVMERQVEAQDVDLSDIVNNAVYAAYAEDVTARALAEAGWTPERLRSQGLTVVNRRFHIQYQAPAVWGDHLRIVTYQLELGKSGGVRYVAVQHAPEGTGIIECVMDWSLVDRLGGEEQPLPDSLARALEAELAVPS